MRVPYTKCCDCGKFFGFGNDCGGQPKMRYEPLSEYGPEVIEWTCAKCVLKDAEALEND